MPEGFSYYEVSRNRRSRWWWVVIGFVATPACVWLVFTLGQQRASLDGGEGQRDIIKLEQRANELEHENAVLRDQMGILERSVAVDKEAYGHIERSLKALQDENYTLKQQLTVFQSIVAAESEPDVVTVQQFTLKVGKKARQYHYRLHLMQSSTSAPQVKGKVTFQIEGLRDGKEQSAPLSLLTQGRISEQAFQFRQMQNFEGEITMPDNFEPVRVRVRISVQGKAGTKQVSQAEKIFDWLAIVR